MVEILSQIKNTLESNSVKNVFLAYDAIPVRDKGEFFTVLSFSGYEAMPPIRTDSCVYMPVKGEVVLTVFAPMKTTQEQIYDYYYSNFENTINNMSCLSTRFRSLEIAPDSKLDRLTLKAVLKVSCMKTISL